MRLFSFTFLLLPITYAAVSAQSPAAYIKTDVVPGSDGPDYVFSEASNSCLWNTLSCWRAAERPF
jgi:hypothetical protein